MAPSSDRGSGLPLIPTLVKAPVVGSMLDVGKVSNAGEQESMHSGIVHIKGEGVTCVGGSVEGSGSESSEGLPSVTSDVSGNQGGARGSGGADDVDVVINSKSDAGDLIYSNKTRQVEYMLSANFTSILSS